MAFEIDAATNRIRLHDVAALAPTERSTSISKLVSLRRDTSAVVNEAVNNREDKGACSDSLNNECNNRVNKGICFGNRGETKTCQVERISLRREA